MLLFLMFCLEMQNKMFCSLSVSVCGISWLCVFNSMASRVRGVITDPAGRFYALETVSCCQGPRNRSLKDGNFGVFL